MPCLCPGKWQPSENRKISPGWLQTEFPQDMDSLYQENVTGRTCRRLSGWRESTALDSDKRLTFEQRELNKREYVKLIWKVLFKSAHTKAFSIKAFLLPWAHLPEFSWRGPQAHWGPCQRKFISDLEWSDLIPFLTVPFHLCPQPT